jgi:hypothetical protein
MGRTITAAKVDQLAPSSPMAARRRKGNKRIGGFGSAGSGDGGSQGEVDWVVGAVHEIGRDLWRHRVPETGRVAEPEAAHAGSLQWRSWASEGN